MGPDYCSALKGACAGGERGARAFFTDFCRWCVATRFASPTSAVQWLVNELVKLERGAGGAWQRREDEVVGEVGTLCQGSVGYKSVAGSGKWHLQPCVNLPTCVPVRAGRKCAANFTTEDLNN